MSTLWTFSLTKDKIFKKNIFNIYNFLEYVKQFAINTRWDNQTRFYTFNTWIDFSNT